MVNSCREISIHVEKSPQFFKVYLPHLSSERLRIPQPFIKNFKSIPTKANLKNSYGRLWHVELKKIENGLFIQNGWQAFVNDNLVEHGDFLVFKYNQNCIFDVRLFGKNGCRKEGVLPTDKAITYVKKEIDSEEEQTHTMPTLVYKQNSSEASLKRFKNSSGGYRGGMPAIQRGRPKRKRPNTTDDKKDGSIEREDSLQRCLSKRSRPNTSDDEEVRCLERENSLKICLPKRSQPNTTDDKKVGSLERHNSTKNPTFMVTLKETYLLSLGIPFKFMNTYLKKEYNSVILQDSDGRRWFVNCWRGARSSKLTTGWRAFAEDNRLKVGDVCVFELIKKAKNSFKVFIDGATETAANRLLLRRKGIHIDEGSLCKRDCNKSMPNIDGALKGSKALVPENPYFKVTMTPSYVISTFCLNIPLKFVQRHFTRKQKDAILRGIDGRSWLVKCCWKQRSSKFSSGWRAFVEDNHLKVGDVCVFELITELKNSLLVTIFRADEGAKCIA